PAGGANLLGRDLQRAAAYLHRRRGTGARQGDRPRFGGILARDGQRGTASLNPSGREDHVQATELVRGKNLATTGVLKAEVPFFRTRDRHRPQPDVLVRVVPHEHALRATGDPESLLAKRDEGYVDRQVRLLLAGCLRLADESDAGDRGSSVPDEDEGGAVPSVDGWSEDHLEEAGLRRG